MEVHAAPYLDPYVAGGSILVKMGRIEADLPEWLDVVIFGLSLVLPPVTILLPNVLAALIHNALVDVSNRLNGRAARNGFSLRDQFALPGTSGPTYDFEPSGVRP